MDGDETRLAATIHRYLLNNKAYGETGIRDTHLQLNGVTINVRFLVLFSLPMLKFRVDKARYILFDSHQTKCRTSLCWREKRTLLKCRALSARLEEARLSTQHLLNRLDSPHPLAISKILV